MGRSQETFNKKEKEKQKARKKRDKAEKMEDRKANATKGKSLEDMMAYVDENGNLVDSPPDPKKKKEINTEDIQIGVSRQADTDDASSVRKGTITNFNDSKGYGFIRTEGNGESIFVHISGLVDQVREGDKVTFDVEKGPKGLSATNVKKA
jgi:cold shock CspA family protein